MEAANVERLSSVWPRRGLEAVLWDPPEAGPGLSTIISARRDHGRDQDLGIGLAVSLTTAACSSAAGTSGR